MAAIKRTTSEEVKQESISIALDTRDEHHEAGARCVTNDHCPLRQVPLPCENKQDELCAAAKSWIKHYGFRFRPDNIVFTNYNVAVLIPLPRSFF